MITFDFSSECENSEELAGQLEKISSMLREGYTSGFYPTWSISGEENTESEFCECGFEFINIGNSVLKNKIWYCKTCNKECK